MTSAGSQRYTALLLEPLTLDAVSAEVARARLKFPGPQELWQYLAALSEECGELANALLEGKPRDDVEREAIQVAAVALRMVEELHTARAGTALPRGGK